MKKEINGLYYYANDKLLASKENSSAKTYYHGDHLGPTTLVTNQSGNITEEEFSSLEIIREKKKKEFKSLFLSKLRSM